MKKIVASGCSFTDRKWNPLDYNGLPPLWDKWPEVIHRWNNNFSVQNVGKVGASTQLIIKNASIEIYKEKPDIVLLQLTDWQRWSAYGAETMAFHAIGPQLDSIDRENRFRAGLYVWRHTPPKKLITENFLMILNFIHTCKSLNIKLLIGQNHIGPLWFDLFAALRKNEKDVKRIEEIYPGFFEYPKMSEWFDKEFLYKQWLDNPYFKEMDKHKDCLIGWPWLPEIGGKFISSKNFEISERDHHPDKTGQEFIAEQYFRRL